MSFRLFRFEIRRKGNTQRMSLGCAGSVKYSRQSKNTNRQINRRKADHGLCSSDLLVGLTAKTRNRSYKYKTKHARSKTVSVNRVGEPSGWRKL
jgi:hypothetical protein